MSDELTARESRRLKNLEESIGRSASTMYDCMRAIHDEKLYRAEYKTWEEYCRARWSMTPQHANRLIEHGKVLSLWGDDKTEPIGSLSEAATREIAALPDEQKVQVIKEVAEESKASKNGKPRVTAAAVREKVKQAKPAKATADLVESYRDDNDNEVPESLFPVWRERDKYFRIADDLKTLSGEIKELSTSPAGRGLSQIWEDVETSGKELMLKIPSVVDGKKWKSLEECK